MSKIRIKNFGPIRQGMIENDGWIDIKKVTMFLGDQGTGKSTLAKLFSTFSWIEKVLMRGDINSEEVINPEKFKKLLNYHRLENYFLNNSYLEYQSDYCNILFENNECYIKFINNKNYNTPQIMYVPSERNFISYVSKPELVNLVSESLKIYISEFVMAKEALNSILKLPFGNASLKWNSVIGELQIVGDKTDSIQDYTLNVSEASSGFQSSVPVYLITNYLTNKIKNYTQSESWRLDLTPRQLNLLIEKQRQLQKEFLKTLESMQNIFDKSKNQTYVNIKNKIQANEIKNISKMIKSYEKLFIKSHIINIVEEPEQNLYPESQKKILECLLEYNNVFPENKLVITSHSPYLINVITIAVKVNQLIEKSKDFKNSDEIKNKLSNLFPISSSISNKEVIIYELSDQGEIRQLESFEELPSDDNVLNRELSAFNDLFSELLEIESEIIGEF